MHEYPRPSGAVVWRHFFGPDMTPKECDISVPSNAKSVSKICDCAHTVVILKHIVVFTIVNQPEIKVSNPEMGIRFPPCDIVPSAAYLRNKADVWLDMFRL